MLSNGNRNEEVNPDLWSRLQIGRMVAKMRVVKGIGDLKASSGTGGRYPVVS